MRAFRHADALWADYPELVAGVVYAAGVGKDKGVDSGGRADAYAARAAGRLAAGPESELPEVRAWRRAFGRMGLKPTQYRCASESLLRRFRKEGALPRIHPLVDLCNAVSLAYAIPVAALDAGRIGWPVLEVRYASGEEVYETFGGGTELPRPGEVAFVDADGRAHARRWTNRQSGWSAVSPETTDVLIVAEGLHDTARRDVQELVENLVGELRELWGVEPSSAVLSRRAPRFELPDLPDLPD
jgi:DNA/RNA-binding domain of Phe-tRNA-synthetase-like protein